MNGPERGGASSTCELKLQDGESSIAADPSSPDAFSAWERTCATACAEQFAPCAAAWENSSSEPTDLDDTKAPHILVARGGWEIAVAAGLVMEEDMGPSVHALEEALQKLKDVSAKPDTPAGIRANIVRLYGAVEALFRNPESARARCKLAFGNVWTVDSGHFQDGWLAGHFLDAIGEKEVDEPADATEDMQKQSSGNDIAVAEAAQEPTGIQADDASKADGFAENPFTLPPPQAAEASRVQDTNAGATKAPGQPVAEKPLQLPQSKHPRANDVNASSPGLVVYVVAPAAAATGEAALSAEEYQGLSVAAVRSGATVVLSASAPAMLAAIDFEVARINKILREVNAFANSRFQAPGGSRGPQALLQDLFDAIASQDAVVLDVEAIALGLRGLGFPGDVVSAAAALTPDGSNRVSKEDFTKILVSAVEQPDLVTVCPEQIDPGGTNAEDLWPAVRTVTVSSGLLGADALKAKANEAIRLAGTRESNRGATGHGVVLVLAARGRALLQPPEYEEHIRKELHMAAEMLPPRWPLLWSPGPAEVGLLSELAAKRPVWAMPKATGPDTLASWLRYLLVVRPAATAIH